MSDCGGKPVAGREILALTFTRDAAAEMKTRLLGMIGEEGNPAKPDSPWFGTFHAFALRLIRGEHAGVPNWSRLGYARLPSPPTSERVRAWIISRRAELKIGIGVEKLEEIVNGSDSVIEAEVGRDASLSVFHDEYRAFLKAEGFLPFDRMVTEALRLLREFIPVRDTLRREITHVLVDEFQDTSPDQIDLVKEILGEGKNLFLVGDDDQAIYGFRGADPGNIVEAHRRFPGLRILKLEVNYRSSPAIVRYANRVFRDKPAALRKNLQAAPDWTPAAESPSAGGQSQQKKSALGRFRAARKTTAGFVEKMEHPDGVTQGRWMALEMRKLKDQGIDWSEMAILFRINALEDYYRAMVVEGLGSEVAAQIVYSTVHGAKGLEYAAVFFVGLEEGILPYRGKDERIDPARLAEERRIFYVGVTRAKRNLYLCSVRRRVLRGKVVTAKPSRFLNAMPMWEVWSRRFGRALTWRLRQALTWRLRQALTWRLRQALTWRLGRILVSRRRKDFPGC